jgi:hypothetical protein
MSDEKRYYGRLIEDRPVDPRQKYQIVEWVTTPPLPTMFALPFEKVPNIDQGALGSCGPNSLDEIIMWNDAQENLPVKSISRLAIYYWTRVLMGTTNQDSGVDNTSMLKAALAQGVIPEDVWPYTISTYKQKPPAGPATKIIDFSGVIQSIGQMKGTLFGTDGTDGDPFILGFDVFNQIESAQAAADGVIMDPSPNERAIGGHDVTIYGWNDALYSGAGGFLLRNHWRSGSKWWGINGNGTISYAYALNAKLAGDFKVVNSVPGGGPPPPPPPPPGTYKNNIQVSSAAPINVTVT